jgi:DNA-binding transcriptional MerR regulator
MFTLDGMARDDDEGAAYKLDELAERADVSVRTIRYYVQRGLLAAPVFRGKDTAYTGSHLLRLRAIKRLQDDRYLPLDAIAAELEGKSDDEVRALLARLDRPAPVAGPAGAEGGPYRARPHRDAAPPAERWARVQVADGVELHVRQDSAWDPEVLAERLRDAMGRRR